jgi:hypothetical protein
LAPATGSLVRRSSTRPGQPRRRVQLVTRLLRPRTRGRSRAAGAVPLGLHPDLVLAGQHADARIQPWSSAVACNRGVGSPGRIRALMPRRIAPGAPTGPPPTSCTSPVSRNPPLPQPQRHLGRPPGLDRDFIPGGPAPTAATPPSRRTHRQHVVQPEPAPPRGHSGARNGAGEARQLVLAPVASDRHHRPIDGLLRRRPRTSPAMLPVGFAGFRTPGSNRATRSRSRCAPRPPTGTALRRPQPPQSDPAQQHGAQHQRQDREPTTRSCCAIVIAPRCRAPQSTGPVRRRSQPPERCREIDQRRARVRSPGLNKGAAQSCNRVTVRGLAC